MHQVFDFEATEGVPFARFPEIKPGLLQRTRPETGPLWFFAPLGFLFEQPFNIELDGDACGLRLLGELVGDRDGDGHGTTVAPGVCFGER